MAYTWVEYGEGIGNIGKNGRPLVVDGWDVYRDGNYVCSVCADLYKNKPFAKLLQMIEDFERGQQRQAAGV